VSGARRYDSVRQLLVCVHEEVMQCLRVRPSWCQIQHSSHAVASACSSARWPAPDDVALPKIH
jgi:hypothetical protein